MSADETKTTDRSSDRLPEVYALIWKAGKPDGEFDTSEFEGRIPRLMEWLRSLYAHGHLVACGGGGFENHMGGLTLIRASSVEQAMELSSGSPMNEIGTTEVMIWDVYYGDLDEKRTVERLKETPGTGG